MEEHLDIEEGQRLAAAKEFAHRHRFLLATLVVAALVGAAAGWGYSRYQEGQRLEASRHYQQGVKAMAEGRTGDARQALKTLIGDYSGTTYAAMGRVLRARLVNEGGSPQQALDLLAPLVEGRVGAGETRHIAVEEAARIQWGQGDVEAALATLETIAPSAYLPTYFQLRGDLLVAAGRPEEARGAYRRALNRPGGSALAQELEARLDQLPSEAASGASEGGGE